MWHDSAPVFGRLKWYMAPHVSIERLAQLSCSAPQIQKKHTTTTTKQSVAASQKGGGGGLIQLWGRSHGILTKRMLLCTKAKVTFPVQASTKKGREQAGNLPPELLLLEVPILLRERWAHDALSACLYNWFKYVEINGQPLALRPQKNGFQVL